MTGRPKNFCRNQAICKATEVFWEKGFEATSVQDLLDAMEINRGSMYDTFGSKEDLFRECIEQYLENWNTTLSSLLENDEPAIAKIGNVLNAIERTLFDPNADKCKGCLVTNTATELAQQHPEIGEIVREQFSHMEKLLVKAMKTGIQDGELPQDLPVKQHAAYVVSSINGMVVSAKAGASRETIHQIGQVVLGSIEQGVAC